MGELVFNGGMLAFFLAMTANCMTVEIWEGYVGARYWPLVLLVIADALFLAKTVGIYRKLPKSEIKADFSFMKSAKIHRLLLAFIATIAYVAILEIVGYVIATVLFGMAMGAILGQRNPIKLLFASVVITLVIYAIFVWGLDVMVPRGKAPIYYFGLWLEMLI